MQPSKCLQEKYCYGDILLVVVLWHFLDKNLEDMQQFPNRYALLDMKHRYGHEWSGPMSAPSHPRPYRWFRVSAVVTYTQRVNPLGTSNANMCHWIELIFWYQIWIPREISIRMNGNLNMIWQLLATVASKAGSSCVLSSWGLPC